MNPAETESNASIWERLNPEEGITEEHIEYLIDLGIGEFPRMDIKSVIDPTIRARKTRIYMKKHLGLSFDEAAELSGWDKKRLKKDKEKWLRRERVLPLPVTFSILQDVIAKCHEYIDLPEVDKPMCRPLVIEGLNKEIGIRVFKRIQRETILASGESYYHWSKERGSTTAKGFDHLPTDTLVNTLKRLETSLKDRSK